MIGAPRSRSFIFAMNTRGEIPSIQIMRSPSIERQKRRIELRPAVAEYEPIVAQLRKSGQIKGRRQHGIALLGRLGDFAAGGIGDER